MTGFRPCPRGAFSGAPAPSGSRVRTWPSPQDSQCASGQTYLLQPTTLGVLASRLATNLASYPHSPAQPPPCNLSSDWPGCPGQPIEAPFTGSAGPRESEKLLNGCQGQRGTPASAAEGGCAIGQLLPERGKKARGRGGGEAGACADLRTGLRLKTEDRLSAGRPHPFVKPF